MHFVVLEITYNERLGHFKPIIRGKGSKGLQHHLLLLVYLIPEFLDTQKSKVLRKCLDGGVGRCLDTRKFD